MKTIDCKLIGDTAYDVYLVANGERYTPNKIVPYEQYYIYKDDQLSQISPDKMKKVICSKYKDGILTEMKTYIYGNCIGLFIDGDKCGLYYDGVAEHIWPYSSELTIINGDDYIYKDSYLYDRYQHLPINDKYGTRKSSLEFKIVSGNISEQYIITYKNGYRSGCSDYYIHGHGAWTRLYKNEYEYVEHVHHWCNDKCEDPCEDKWGVSCINISTSRCKMTI